MHDVTPYQTNLTIYILIVVAISLLLFAIVNLVFYVLKVCKVFYEKRVWLLTNLVGMLILLASIGPAMLDIYQSSYCKIRHVVNIEVEFKANYSDKYILVTDKDGVVYTCYDFLIDTEAIKNVEYPGTVVYAKHSKLMLDYYTES